MNQSIYDQAIKNGCTHKLAEMLACRRSPRLDTDKAFFNSFGNLGDELKGPYLDKVVAGARANGHDPSQGDVYIPGLADFTGDPKAFVSRSTGAKARLKDHMDYCNSEPLEDPLDQSKQTIADDIIDERVHDMKMEDPGLLERRTFQDVKEEVIAKHGPQN